jgi:hypothetical protein
MGSSVQEFIQRLLDSKQHPQQAFKSCMGVLQLSKAYKSEELEKVCSMAVEYNSISLKFVKNSLTNNVHKTQEDSPVEMELPLHENIRGKDNYK